jgi:hypothetical protein
MSRSPCVTLLLLTCGAVSAQNEEHRVRNIVLVHGAWADGSGWKGVYDILVKDGYNVSIVKSRRRLLKKMWLPRDAALLNKTGRASLSLIATGEP